MGDDEELGYTPHSKHTAIAPCYFSSFGEVYHRLHAHSIGQDPPIILSVSLTLSLDLINTYRQIKYTGRTREDN